MTLKLLKLTLLMAVIVFVGCSKNEDKPSESSIPLEQTEEIASEQPAVVQEDLAYDFPYIDESDFNESMTINNDKNYRDVRFNDYPVGTKIIGAAEIGVIQNIDGHTVVVVSTKQLLDERSLVYGALGAKASFNGNFATLVFEPRTTARILENDIIAFKGVLAPSDLYEYKNPEGNVENIPIIYVHHYEAGDLSIPAIKSFFNQPKKASAQSSNTVGSIGECESQKFDLYKTRYAMWAENQGIIIDSPEYKKNIVLAKESIDQTCLKEKVAADSGIPSFSCTKAKGYVEETICSTPKLALLDVKAVHAYSAAKFFAKDKDEFMLAASQWRKERGKCTSVECIEQQYVNRIAALNAY
jgi:hypothetical protein